MLEAYIALLAIPMVFIVLWEQLSKALSLNSMAVYRLTSIIGTPVHEFAHALGCIIFGMRITRAKFFTVSGSAGPLGYVNFLYNPDSVIHLIGRLIQGIAPLIAGGAIAIYFLDLYPYFTLPHPGTDNLMQWLLYTVELTWLLVKHKATSSSTDLTILILVMVIALHAVPSISDIKIGTKALIITLIFAGLFSVGLQILSDTILASRWPQGIIAWITQWLSYAAYWIRYGLYLVLFGSISVLTLASIMLVTVVLVPSLVWNQFAQVRNKHAKLPIRLSASHPEQIESQLPSVNHMKQERTSDTPNVAEDVQPEQNVADSSAKKSE